VTDDVQPAPLLGRRVSVERATPADGKELETLDWARLLHPAMAGPTARSLLAQPTSAHVIRALATGEIAGVLDAVQVPGYPGVASVSIFVDTARAKGGLAMEAYGLFVTALFDGGVRLVHHEVLELNRPVQRILRGIGVAPSARYRQHAYAAGRFWDVLVFSYDRHHWDHVLEKVVPRNPFRSSQAAPGASD
jgi:RimJ/RimL family protein N-acetyltransferase